MFLKTILFLFAILFHAVGSMVLASEQNLLCTTELPQNACWSPPRSNTLGPYEYGERDKAQQEYERCFEQMESAMRAMEGFIGAPDQYGNPNFLLAQRQWAEAKRDCWRQP